MKDRFMGLDLSLTGTGIITIDENGKRDLEALIQSKKEGDSPVSELHRLKNIVRAAEEIIGCTRHIRFAAIEGIAFGVRKTTHLAQLSALNYMFRDMLHESDVPFVIVAPKTVKKYITGTGNATKEMMMLETLNKFNINFGNDNLCDAYGLAQIAKDLYIGKGLTKDQISVIVNLQKQLID